MTLVEGALLQEHRLDAGGEAELGQLRIHLLVGGVMVQQLQSERHTSFFGQICIANVIF